MSYVPQIFVGNEMAILAASVLIQATIVILIALTAGKLLWNQPALRHSVLLAGLLGVVLCPIATHLADRMDMPLISIRMPSQPTSSSARTVPTTTRDAASGASSEESPELLASLPPSISDGRAPLEPLMPESDAALPAPVREQVPTALIKAIPDETPKATSAIRKSRLLRFGTMLPTSPPLSGLLGSRYSRFGSCWRGVTWTTFGPPRSRSKNGRCPNLAR